MKALAIGLMIMALTLTSCSKGSITGDFGPMGPNGEQGIHGKKGDRGDPGVDRIIQGIPGKNAISVPQARSKQKEKLVILDP